MKNNEDYRLSLDLIEAERKLNSCRIALEVYKKTTTADSKIPLVQFVTKTDKLVLELDGILESEF